MKLSLNLFFIASRFSTAYSQTLRGSDAASFTPRELSGNVFDETAPTTPPAEPQLSGRVIMKRKTSAALRAQGKTEAEINEIRARGLDRIRRNKVVMESPGLDFQVVELSKGQEKKFIDDIMQGEDGALFEYLEPDYIVAPSYTPNDPLLSPYSWQHDKMRSRDAWDTTFGNSTVVVAICDTGLKKDHPDLATNKVEGYNAVQRLWESNGGNPWNTYVSTTESHGTFTASCAAAIGNNNVGTVGSAGNISHRPIQVSSRRLKGSAYESTLAHCAEVACNKGDQVVNLSFTGATSLSRRNAAFYCRGKGSLVFNAAGNDSRDLTSFGNADDDKLIVVGATDSSDNKSTFSAYGSYVDVMAPGTSVVAAGVDSTGNDAYFYVSGTSYSSPLTAGLAALIWSANPALTADQVEQVIKQSADDLGATGYDNTFAYGRINSHKAMLHSLVTP